VKKTSKKTSAKKTLNLAFKKAMITEVEPMKKMAANKMSCKGRSCCSTTWRTIILLIANTILLVFLMTVGIKKSLTNMEVKRVGGIENYELIQKIYDLPAFQQQQKFQIEQTYQALQAAGTQTPETQTPQGAPQQ